MKRTFLLLFSLFSLVSLQAENKVSLTLIPPGKITNKVDLDIRGGIVNESASQQTYQVALYWNKCSVSSGSTLEVTATVMTSGP